MIGHRAQAKALRAAKAANELQLIDWLHHAEAPGQKAVVQDRTMRTVPANGFEGSVVPHKVIHRLHPSQCSLSVLSSRLKYC
jgi:hypothetical protein